MQYSVVYFNDISLESNIFRLDAEFFHLTILETKRKIRSLSFSILRDSQGKIIHPTEIKREYEKEGVQILLAQNIRYNFLDFSVSMVAEGV